MSASHATKHAPLLPATAIGAVYCAEDAQIDTQQFIGALSASVVRSGVRLYENTAVLSVIRQGSHVDGVRTVRSDIRASGVVWATGTWTLKLTAEGIVLPVTTARMGQVVTQPVDQRPSAILHGPRGCPLVEHARDMATFPGFLYDGDVVTLRVQGLGETRQTARASGSPHSLAPRTVQSFPAAPIPPPPVSPSPGACMRSSPGPGSGPCLTADTATARPADRRRRGIPPGRHPLRPAAHPRDAGRGAPAHPGGPDHGGGQHPRRVLRQRR
ncbi:NAD(P)/FAD-dependent oxidoreductase [Streptomyces sp. NPDC058001]|uniref:NAD(P)/FAD-dependent oxidoreductase n=1 Tax=Streptomyces sp. NPDC058001 TaxID=3346300 RepID=UPI0036E89C96